MISELKAASELVHYNLEVPPKSQCRHRRTGRVLQATNYYTEWIGQSQLWWFTMWLVKLVEQQVFCHVKWVKFLWSTCQTEFKTMDQCATCRKTAGETQSALSFDLCSKCEHVRHVRKCMGEAFRGSVSSISRLLHKKFNVCMFILLMAKACCARDLLVWKRLHMWTMDGWPASIC